ncbi:MAG TPA: shikimate dehydrogenase [Candidatus Eisenbacteria bacterium]|nr:shikimate dehydrogenase [Candidatus Eisenbacteria bacterium]
MTGRADEAVSSGRYAVLGDPVRHSLSPPMQNAAFRAAGIDARYEALGVPLERLDAVLAELHAGGVLGLNLTLPLKERAFELARTRTPEAERARAVNTLRREPTGWAGHATDGLGFAAWIQELGIQLEGARVLLLGAGGAAASVAPIVLDHGPAAVAIASRTPARAWSLAERLSGMGSVAIVAGGLEDEADIAREGPYDVLVRALTAEDVSEAEARLWRALEPRAPVLDLNYAERAALVRDRCKKEGRPFEDGLGLLLHQGALSFEFWTGRKAPLQAMRDALRAAARSG